MQRINFECLPKYNKREFVPSDLCLEDVTVIKSLYECILKQKVDSDDAYQLWFSRRAEMEIVLDELGTRLYIEMTCQTDDLALSQKYKRFVEEVLPVVKKYEHRLNEMYLEYDQHFSLKTDQYAIYKRDVSSDVEIFVDKNVDLQTRVQLLSQEYQERLGSLMINLDGREQTLIAASKRFLDPDRSVREMAWLAITQRRLQEKDKLNAVFNEMLRLRSAMAQNANCKDFTQYQFKEYHRFDYTIDKCKEYHQAVETVVVPLWKTILNKRQQQMGLYRLKPWDTSVDPSGLPALQPFQKTQDLVAGCQHILARINPMFGQKFAKMAEEGYLDLDNRKGKAPGGYQSSLNEARKPFIFMNSVGTDSDVKTLLHEAGHALHSLACAQQPILHYLHAPMEFCEVASMTMEMLSLDHLGVFYPQIDDQKRSIVKHLEDVIFILIWVATIDAFQHWIYEHPAHSDRERESAWLEIRRRFGGDLIDWTGHELAHANLWHKQLHIFEVPFYYIEYGIAQLGALRIWLNSKSDYAKAINDFKTALSWGGSKPLPELFMIAGIPFDFSQDTLGPLVEAVHSELKSLWKSSDF